LSEGSNAMETEKPKAHGPETGGQG
jgi:hypothetical protein